MYGVAITSSSAFVLIEWYSDLQFLRKPCISNQDCRGKAVVDDEDESEDLPTEQIRCLTLHPQNSPKLGIEIDSIVMKVSYSLFITETLECHENKRLWSPCNFHLLIHVELYDSSTNCGRGLSCLVCIHFGFIPIQFVELN